MCSELDNDEGLETPDTDVAWKIISYYRNQWITPVRGYPVDVKSGRLDAILTGKPLVSNEAQFIGSFVIRDKPRVNGGAIHCWRTKELAKRNSGSCDIVLKVTGRHHVAHNEDEIAYQEIRWKSRYWFWLIMKMKLKAYLKLRILTTTTVKKRLVIYCKRD